MTIRLICLDLDGTTLRRDGTVSPRTVAALRRAMEAGATVAIATGRMFGSAAIFGRQIGINGPVIASNGAQVRELSGRIIMHRPMPQSRFKAAAAVAPGASDISFELFGTDDLFVADVARRRRDAWRWRLKHANSLAGFLMLFKYIGMYRLRPLREADSADKVFLGGKDPARLQAVCDQLTAAVDEPLTVCSSGADNLEITALNVSKGSAVTWLAEHLGLRMDEVMVAGDSLNDLSMFELDCFKVAMANAEAQIRDRASFITASHQDDGVALAVERFVLGEAAV